jgi:intein/homing endonuclease
VDVLLKNDKGLKILTDTGFSDFEGLIEKSIQKMLCIHLKNSSIKCTPDHKIFLEDLTNKESKDLEIGDKVYTSYGIDLVVSINQIESEKVYDVFDVKHNNRFYANDILIKNCEFLVYDETLINAIKLASLEGAQPILNMGQTRWYKKPNPNYNYVVALDPSMGTGGNNAAIQVIELPTYEQVAEWQHNTTAIPGQIRVLKDICQYIADTTHSGGSNVYWSVENNGIGEAALIVINDFGEEHIPGLFVSEPIRKGHVRKFRKGFNTTHGTKISACSRLKTMVENDKMIVNSKPFISELKNFIATGSTFKAKLGATDDLVSSMILALRVITVMRDWDPAIYNTFVQIEAEDDYELPMPIFVSSNY